MTVISGLSSITCETAVQASPERTFEVFTGEMGRWWPPEYHIGAAVVQDVVVEPRVGGRWFERGVDGSESDWGHVVQWQPAALLVLSWQLTSHWQFDPDRSKGSEVVVRFTRDSATVTRVELEHRYFERHGPDAAGVRSALAGDHGWAGVLPRFSRRVADRA